MFNTTLYPFDLTSYEETANDTLPFLSDLDVFFKPDPVLIALYVPTIALSMVANILLIVVVLKCNYIKNVTNIFLVNLSVADLFVTFICMPIQLSKAITLVWYYGESVCKLANYIQGVAVAASVFTLAAMSVDRWLSISPKPNVNSPGRRQAVFLLSLLWIAALLIFIPLLVVAKVQEEPLPILNLKKGNASIFQTKKVHFCTENWQGPGSRQQFGTFSFSMVYAIPGTITIMSYVFMGRTLCNVRPPFDIFEGQGMQQGVRLMKERRRIAWILLLLAVLFALCWLPYNIMQLLLDIDLVNTKSLSAFLPYALYLGHANSAINPIVYCLMTKNFQRSARKLMCRKGVCRETKFTWRCNQKPEASSSDYDNFHEPHKRCYLQMTTIRDNCHVHCHSAATTTVPTRRSQLSHVTRTSRRTAPANAHPEVHLQRCNCRH